MIAPELLRVGIAQADNDFCYVSVLDVMSVRDQEPQRAVMVPGDGQTRVPLCLAKEYPDPRPAGAVAVAGYPITLSWHDSLEVTAILEAARGSQVECWVSTPSAPANFSRPDSASSVCLLPKKPLERKTMYTVTVTAGETTWSWSLTTR
jgi:hypothetical protein